MRFLIFLPLLALLALPLRAQDASALVTAARAQVGVTLIYDGAYVALDYPGGDVAPDRGVCTDVLIRALRTAWGIDLQRAVHADMTRAFGVYPDQWGLTAPDRNIDHRRVPNLRVLFARAGAELEPGGTDYRPGDIVSWRLPGNQPHIGIVSDRLGDDGVRPLILHNIGGGAQEEDMLHAFPITGHYRITAEAAEWLRALDR
jgi:uncharacterized protein YijF (DUF1287 family)